MRVLPTCETVKLHSVHVELFSVGEARVLKRGGPLSVAFMKRAVQVQPEALSATSEGEVVVSANLKHAVSGDMKHAKSVFCFTPNKITYFLCGGAQGGGWTGGYP